MNFQNIKLNKEILESQKVELVVVFGSHTEGTAHAGSDLDIGVVFYNEKIKMENPVEVYGVLLEEIRRAFNTENIDIVYLKESPLSLQFHAVENGIAVYQCADSSLADYKEDVMKKYFDFKFFEDIFNESLGIQRPQVKK